MMKHLLGDDDATIPFLPIQRHSPGVMNTQQLVNNSVSNDSGPNYTKREEEFIERAGKMLHHNHSSFSSSQSSNDSTTSTSTSTTSSSDSSSESDNDTTASNSSLEEDLSHAPMINRTSERHSGYLSESSSSGSSSSTSSGSL